MISGLGRSIAGDIDFRARREPFANLMIYYLRRRDIYKKMFHFFFFLFVTVEVGLGFSNVSLRDFSQKVFADRRV